MSAPTREWKSDLDRAAYMDMQKREAELLAERAAREERKAASEARKVWKLTDAEVLAIRQRVLERRRLKQSKKNRSKRG